MADSTVAIFKLLEAEGGLLRDGDGITKWGICSRFNPGVDVEHMTAVQAANWYFKNRWLAMRLFRVDDQQIAEQLLDAGTHCGMAAAIRIVQRAYNNLYPAHPLAVDGVIGPKTAAAFNAIPGGHKPAFLNVIRHQRVRYYLDTLRVHPEKEKNRVGWMNRI
jgi:lysozyme family protein